MKQLIFILAAVLAFPLTASSQEPASESLPALVAVALEKNPELAASEARWQMLRNRVLHEGRLEDPMLMLKIQNGLVKDPFNFSKDPMTQKVVGISQQLPFWGKRALRSELADREAEASRWTLEERKLELKRMVTEAYYQLYFTDRALKIVERNIGIIDDFVVLAETKYSVGQGPQQDVFKAQVERSKMLEMKISLEQQRRSQQATLNGLLNRPPDTTVGSIPDFEIRPVTLSPADLYAAALESRPQLKGLAASVEKGNVGRKLAEKDFYPDFNVSLEYMQRNAVNGEPGWDMYSLGVTFNLPVFRHHRAEMVAEADSSVRMAREEMNVQKNTISAGITDLLAQLERRKKLAELYRNGIIPQAEQSLESATIGYRVNKVDFLTLLDSRVTLFNYEREYHESLAEYQMKLAQLEALVGRGTGPESVGIVPAAAPAPVDDHGHHGDKQ